jgi:hypothetical protein
MNMTEAVGGPFRSLRTRRRPFIAGQSLQACAAATRLPNKTEAPGMHGEALRGVIVSG